MELDRKNEILQEIVEEEKKKIEDSFLIGRHVKDPHEKLHFCSRIEIVDDIFRNRFI